VRRSSGLFFKSRYAASRQKVHPGRNDPGREILFGKEANGNARDPDKTFASVETKVGPAVHKGLVTKTWEGPWSEPQKNGECKKERPALEKQLRPPSREPRRFQL